MAVEGRFWRIPIPGHVYTLVVDAKTKTPGKQRGKLRYGDDIVQCQWGSQFGSVRGASFAEIWHVPNNIGPSFMLFAVLHSKKPCTRSLRATYYYKDAMVLGGGFDRKERILGKSWDSSRTCIDFLCSDYLLAQLFHVMMLVLYSLR